MAFAAADRESSGDNRRPMYALYEDAGKFHAGRVMSETESSLQIELASGKRAKVKAESRARDARQPKLLSSMTPRRGE